MNKTTSFSKIKNNLIKTNDIFKQEDYEERSFFIDSINEPIENQYEKSNLLFEPAPVELFADSIISSKLDDSNLTKLKNWNSESNLSKAKSKLIKLNKSCINSTANDVDTADSYYDYELENGQLQFSDHAGLYDYEEQSDPTDTEPNLLLNNYDVFKATKKNYKLTYNEQLNSKQMQTNKYKMNNYQQQQNDSFINSDLVMQQSNNLDESNYNDYDEDDNDEYRSNEHENQFNTQTQTTTNDYYYYLNKLTNSDQQQNKDLYSSINSNANLNDSIMNWSMKISNYNYNNNYQLQKQHIQHQLNKRSQSRSPLVEQQYQIPRSNSSFSKLAYKNGQKTIQPLSNKSTTSWGKLKHSKSSSSNVGVTTSFNANISNEIQSSIHNQLDYDDDQQLLQSVHIKDQHQQTGPVSSPSLFRLFQDTKTGNKTFDDLNSSSEANSYSTNLRSNRCTDHLKETNKTSFSKLRQRSLSSCAIGKNNSHQNDNPVVVVVDTSNKKKSIGIQHPPLNQIDQSIQTSTIVCMLVDRNNSKTSKELMEVAARAARAAVAARRSYNLFNTKSSLPDLTFLKDYSDEIPSEIREQQFETNNSQLKTSLSSANLIKPISELIKLDELAIKKTINQQQQQQPPITGSELLKRKTLKSIKRYRQTKQNTEPCNLITDTANESKQLKPNSASSSTSSSNATNTSGYVSNVAQQQDKQKQPLKSCLKRKDSASNQQFNPIKQASSLISPNIQMNKQIVQKKTSTQMFVPYVGYLYTWDKDSSTRYVYYNNLERSRRIKSYRQIIKSKKLFKTDDEEDEEDEDEYDDLEDESKQKQLNEPIVHTSRSYNDLRVKKSVTFLSHVIEHIQSNKKSKSNSISPSSTNTTIETGISSPITLPTIKQLRPAAPLLQYDALIAMLKSNSIQKNQETKNKSPQQLNRVDNRIRISKNSKIERHNSETYFKNKSQIIDADSISLASLSESPPSEFKFSDDEDYDVNKADEQLSQAIKLNTSTKSFNNTMTTNSSSASSSSSAASSSASSHNINYQTTLSKQQQLIKFNQIELIRNKKKNFHSILLKDSKLNNLKEILLEIKEQQQKLIYLASESKAQLKSKDINENPNGLAHLLTPSSSSSSSSTTLNQTSIIATTNSNDNIVSIELKDTIERLAQFLFEFLKQGLKPASFESLQSNLSNSTIKTMSPTLVERALPDSSSLTLTYSQYTQLWNLIEYTINLAISTEQQNDSSFQLFKLPKEAYINMFQEINNYASNTNQTYLIDSGINTSQLRRKHHFMVNLMSLKFKFQLFIINLLNYKQLANWFEYLNKDKLVLKKYYDLKLISSNSNNSGDSGVGDFICMSASSSSTNSSLSVSTHNNPNTNGYNLIASLSLTSLANVSIFENEEYFSYFHKLIQQFNFIEFNLKISKDKIFDKQPIKQQKPVKQIVVAPPPPRKSSSSLSRRNSNAQQNPHLTSSPSTPNTCAFSTSNANHSVFNLKNISKRLNIKSWFSSGQNQSNYANNATLPSMSANNLKQHASSGSPLNYKKKNPVTSSPQISSQVYKKSSNAPIKTVGTKSRGPMSKILNTSSLMKHSLSEPTLNEIIE